MSLLYLHTDSSEAGEVVWYSSLFQNFPQFVVVHTVKVFGIVNKAEVDVFLELSCFFDYPTDVGNLIFGSSACSKSSLNIWKFMVHVLLKPGVETFEHYFTSMWDECNCAVVWAFFGVAFLWDLLGGWNELRCALSAWQQIKPTHTLYHTSLWSVSTSWSLRLQLGWLRLSEASSLTWLAS